MMPPNSIRAAASSRQWLVAAVLLVCLSATVTVGQQPIHSLPLAAPAGKTYRIAGILTNSATGEAVSGATIDLHGGQPLQTLQAAVTGLDGQFAFDPVPAAKYSIVASCRGYLTANFDQHDQYSSAIVTGEGQDTEHIPFRLNPTASIRGVVTDDAGEPVPNASVFVMRKTAVGGLGEHLARSLPLQTDDTGLFEVWGLQPGAYLVAVRASPWFAVHNSSSEMEALASDEARADAAALDVAYPVTYYPGSTDESAAAPILVASGDRVDADLTLHAVPAIHLTVHSAPGGGGEEQDPRLPHLSQLIFGSEEVRVYGAVPVGPPESHASEFTGIAPGHYIVRESDSPRTMETEATGNQEVDLAAGTPVGGVVLTVRMSDASPLPASLRMTLLSDDAVRRTLQSSHTDKPTFRFNSVPSGRWIVLAETASTALAVSSIAIGADTHADSRIVVKDRPVVASATLAQGKTNIEGFVTKNGKGEAGVMVVLVPRDPAASLEDFRRDQSDSDGSFVMVQAVPGDYKIVAIEDGWELDWARPEVIARYLQGSVPVTVTAKSGASIHLSADVVVQPR
jgi:hypothetical protein